MKNPAKIYCVITFLMVLGFNHSSYSQNYFADDFEYTDYVTNHGWQFYPFGDNESVYTSDAMTYEGLRALVMDSRDDDEQRITHFFNSAITNVKVEVFMYDDVSQAFGFHILHVANDQTSAHLGFRSSLHGSYYSTDTGNLASWEVTTVRRSTGWHKLSYEIDASGIKYYIDNILVRASTHLKDIKFVQLMCGNHGYGYENSIVYFDQLKVYAETMSLRFTEVAAELDVNDFSSASANWVDFNNDGWLDIYTSSLGVNRLYVNLRGVAFIDSAAEYGVADENPTMCVDWGDFDNDGDPDVYVANVISGGGGQPENRFFRNNGPRVPFTDIAPLLGMNDANQGYGVSWGDFDLDGDLDLYLSNHDAPFWIPTPNKLFINMGNGIFTENASGYGLADMTFSHGATWVDFDHDFDLDLYIPNQPNSNRLYRNDNGIFTNVAPQMGIDINAYSYGGSWDDFDNDGDLDLFQCIADQNSRLFRNDGNVFTDVTAMLNVPPFTAAGAAWGDFDNDGDLDLFVPRGDERAHHLFRNDGNIFTDIAPDLGITFVSDNAHGIGWGDYDRDGDLDAYISNVGGNNRLLRNDGGNSNNWITIKTVGTVSNRDGLGAWITLKSGALILSRVVNTGSAFSRNSIEVEFGLGQHSTIDEIEVRWPSGIVQTLANVSVNQYLTIVETPPPLQIVIDIKPGSDPNAINPNNRGVIPVAILSTSTVQGEAVDFDAATVDPLSVKFGPNQATESHGKGHIEDADGDGDLDLVLHFKTQQTGIQCGDAEASLVGKTFSGQKIVGTDDIQTVGCGPGKAFAENEDSMILPDSYGLSQNYPNPFNPETEIHFALPEPTHVTLKIFNANGQEIRALVDEEKQPGSYKVHWDGRDNFGKLKGSGLYFYTLRAGEFRETRKALLLR